MKTFPTQAEAAAFLKGSPVGIKCISQSEIKLARACKNDLHNYGLRTKVTGSAGNWTIELLTAYDPELERERAKAQVAYFAPVESKLPVTEDGKLDWDFVKHLNVGDSILVKDVNPKSLRRIITRIYGAWTCTINKEPNGWLVTRRSEKSDKALIETFKPQKQYAVGWEPPKPKYPSVNAKRAAAKRRNVARKRAKRLAEKGSAS